MDFETYVAEQGRALLRLAYVLTTDSQLAEDLTQTVLANAYERWQKVSKADSPHAYMRKMLVNTHLDWHRKRSSTERPSDLHTRDDDARHPDPADDIVSRDALRHQLAGLAPRARAVLVLRYYADLDDNAIADTMGITASAVRSTASRALATLREQRADRTLTEETP